MKTDPDRWQIQEAYLAYQKDKGAFICITCRPLRAMIMEWAGDRLFFAPPEWAYRVRWGSLGEYGVADRSLGHRLFQLSQWCGSGFGTWKLKREVAEIPLTPAQVLEHFPDADPFFWEARDDRLGGDAARWVP